MASRLTSSAAFHSIFKGTLGRIRGRGLFGPAGEVTLRFLYTGLSLQADKEKFALKGYTFLKDTVSSYIATLLHSEGREMTAHKILSDRTAFLHQHLR